MTQKTAILFLAPGFEEIEAVSVYDILRRANVDVTLAGLSHPKVIGAHGLIVETSCTVESAIQRTYDMVILPGGEPGVSNLQAYPGLINYIEKQVHETRWIAAICAAPRLLNPFLKNKKATSYPGVKDQMTHCFYQEDPVVIDAPFITSRGPGTSMAFAYAILRVLSLETMASTLETAMLASS